MPGTKLSAGTRRPTRIIAEFRTNRMTIWAIVNEVPVRGGEVWVKSSTISIAVNEPRTWTGRILRITSRFGPPAANVPAHEMNTAHGGEGGDPFEIVTVVIASSDAEISLGRFSQLRLRSAGAGPASGVGSPCAKRSWVMAEATVSSSGSGGRGGPGGGGLMPRLDGHAAPPHDEQTRRDVGQDVGHDGAVADDEVGSPPPPPPLVLPAAPGRRGGARP